MGPEGTVMAASLASTDLVDFLSSALLTCQQGVMFNTQKILTPTPTPWEAFRNVSCGLEEVCQETLLLIDVGEWSVQDGGTPERGPGSPALDGVP